MFIAAFTSRSTRPYCGQPAVAHSFSRDLGMEVITAPQQQQHMDVRNSSTRKTGRRLASSRRKTHEIAARPG